MGGGGVSIRCDEDDGDDSVSVGQGGSLARRKRDQEGAWAHSPFVLGPGPSLLPIPSPQMTILPLISPFPPLPLILLEQVIERQPVGDEVGKEVKEVDGAEGDPIPEPEKGGKKGVRRKGSICAAVSSCRGHHCSRIDSLHRQSRRHADPSFPPFLPPHQIFPSAWSPASKARKDA